MRHHALPARLRGLVTAATAALAVAVTPALVSAGTPSAATTAPGVPTPAQYFGFAPGTEGRLAGWDDLTAYLRTVADRSDAVTYEEIGSTTMGNDFPVLTVSSPENLANLDRITAINKRLSDPRGLSSQQAKKLAAEGKPVYLLEGSIHSTEVGTAQVMPGIVHRLATETSSTVQEILDNAVIVVIPSQNPDGQKLVVDHFHETAGTDLARVYPDLYHKYVGHDDNRDWFMLTQPESQLSVALQNDVKPAVVHNLHQMGADGPRIFNPPYLAPSDPNIHPITVQQTNSLGMEMGRQLTAEGKKGVTWADSYDYWTPSRQYMTYHGAPRLLTEVASVDDLTYDHSSADGEPLGPQEPDTNFIEPYDQSTWSLEQIVDYLDTAVFAGLSNVAKYHEEWLLNLYRTQRDAVSPAGKPYAYVVPADQEDPYATLDLLTILDRGDVEIRRATAPFTAGGERYAAGSWIVEMAQPYGRWAKTLLEEQHYPDLREYPDGPPMAPYDVTAQTLPLLLGVDVTLVEDGFSAQSEQLDEVRPVVPPMPARPDGAYVVAPDSYGTARMIDALQDAGVPTYRATAELTAAGETFAPGALVVPPTADARKALAGVSRQTGIPVFGVDEAPDVDTVRLKDDTRVGLYRGIDNMPGGWMMWLFDQYGTNYEEVAAEDFAGDLNEQYDTIVFPAGISQEDLVEGLDREKYPEKWSWAYGVGENGWAELRSFVDDGGTVVAIGSSVEMATDLYSLPLTRALPTEETEFYSPGSILQQRFDVTNPVAWGMDTGTPVWFGEDDMSYDVAGDGTVVSSFPEGTVVSSFPESGEQLASGWLIGDEHLNGTANVVSFDVGEGTVVTFGSEPTFRTWSREPSKMLFNAIYQGAATPVAAGDLAAALTDG